MKYTKKLVLVPVERYEQLQNSLLKVPKDSGAEEKSTAFARMTQQSGCESENGTGTSGERVQEGGSGESGAASQAEHSATLEDKHIVDSVGQKFRNKAANLLAYVRRVTPEGEMAWNKRGELIYKGDTIAGSNIIDLFRSVMHNPPPRTAPSALNVPGSQAFEDMLRHINVPVTLLGSSGWRKKLSNPKAQHVESQAKVTGPPIPKQKGGGMVKKTHKRTKKNAVKWISL